MCIFNIGLTYGLGAIGSQTGGVLPAAFMEIPVSESSPIFNLVTGLSIVIGFAFILGFGATLAEPALNALGLTVQDSQMVPLRNRCSCTAWPEVSQLALRWALVRLF